MIFFGGSKESKVNEDVHKARNTMSFGRVDGEGLNELGKRNRFAAMVVNDVCSPSSSVAARRHWTLGLLYTCQPSSHPSLSFPLEVV
ncbi:hypothetical protein TIFTF001_024155 [Ficus carica]|uniref:Uncharacterized protein n=1 Tax=Ficus carica TaxID=3494 RepID=A0AA88DGQ4_FICCA|nr:hypothetical protein TIFTF001_024155 [Ficus carica]